MNDGMVQLNKVTKAYGSFQLDCSMEVQPGMATGFVGANGAGKTTTFQILLGLVPPETGEIRIFGIPYTELTAKDREILVRYYYCYETVRQIAETLCLSESAVKMRMSRARKRLQQELIARGYAYEESPAVQQIRFAAIGKGAVS